MKSWSRKNRRTRSRRTRSRKRKGGKPGNIDPAYNIIINRVLEQCHDLLTDLEEMRHLRNGDEIMNEVETLQTMTNAFKYDVDRNHIQYVRRAFAILDEIKRLIAEWDNRPHLMQAIIGLKTTIVLLRPVVGSRSFRDSIRHDRGEPRPPRPPEGLSGNQD
jgi:hypothetical protein